MVDLPPQSLDVAEAPWSGRAKHDSSGGQLHTVKSEAGTRPSTQDFNRYAWWHARFWHGMTAPVWFSFLSRNRYAVAPYRWGLAATVSGVSLVNSVLAEIQELGWGRAVRRTEIDRPPIFIIGHWRSGTTYLHQLMVLDRRFGYPDTYDCMVPCHSLITRAWLPVCLGFLLPAKRPMDNVAVGWKEPQEDEFALCNLGAGSPYARIAFPNRPQGEEYLDLEQVSLAEQQQWAKQVRWFLQMLTYREQKQIVLKSPPHTARIKHLLQIFPGAKFVHILRDPLELIASTRRLWKSLYESQGFQAAKLHDLDPFVFRSMEQMYAAFHRQRDLIPAGQYSELLYQDLVRDPVGQLARVYADLQLGDFAQVEPQIAAFAGEQASYQRNRHSLDEQTRQEIVNRLGPLFDCWPGLMGSADKMAAEPSSQIEEVAPALATQAIPPAA